MSEKRARSISRAIRDKRTTKFTAPKTSALEGLRLFWSDEVSMTRSCMIFIHSLLVCWPQLQNLQQLASRGLFRQPLKVITVSFRQATFGKIALVFVCSASVYAGAISDTNGEIRICTYNVENYLTMPRWVNGKLRRNAGKPESEREAVTRMIETIHPDVIGLMEIGEMRQLEEVQSRLRKSGIDYPYAEYLQGSDTTRHIAMLSRYPIIERHSRGELPLWVNGVTLHSPRGLLDVTVEPAPGYRLRILCVHLKAKLEVAEYDETQLRLAESKEIRRIVRDILRIDPETRLILMGDFNDTKNGEPLWQISGKPDWPDSLRAAALVDDRGESWTEYWSAADVYSRIDYILTAKKLEPEINMAHSGIARPSFWNEASDHCPLSLSLKIPRTTTP